MNRSSKDMYQGAGAVGLALAPAFVLARMLRGTRRGTFSNARQAASVGAVLGGTIGGAVGIGETHFDENVEQPQGLINMTVGGAALGAATGIAISVLWDLTDPRQRRFL